MSDFNLSDMYRMHYTQPIEQAALQATVEIVELNSWLDDHIGCQGSDQGHGPVRCSLEVTHLANGCNKLDVPVCTVLVVHKRHLIDTGMRCVCEELAADCWSYRPI